MFTLSPSIAVQFPQMGDVLRERKATLKESQQKEIEAMKSEHKAHLETLEEEFQAQACIAIGE